MQETIEKVVNKKGNNKRYTIGEGIMGFLGVLGMSGISLLASGQSANLGG